MEIDALMDKLRSFVDDHGITSDLTTRWAKLQGEVDELDHAIMENDTPEIIKECCDIIIVAIHIMTIAGAVNPVWHCYNKLEEVANRPNYLAIAERVRERRKAA